jgi:hypothetical protein
MSNMSRKNLVIFLAVLSIAMLALAACAGPVGEQGPAGPQGDTGPAGPAGADGADADLASLTCTECHNDTTLITGKEAQYDESLHANGEAYVRGTSAGCAGCHSGGAFSEMIAAGGNPSTVEAGDPNPTRQDCRTCHEIHTTYTGEDWALATTDAVVLYAFADATFDGGMGNLCANCHQPRRGFDSYISEDGTSVTGISSHWGPHHGPQSAMLLGVAGAGVDGSASPHMKVTDTCVTCHMGEGDNHTWEIQDAACVECHGEDFDYSEAQAEVQALLDELGDKLVAAGLLSSNDVDGHPAVASDAVVPVDQATALWNWIMIAHEDKSLGGHNMSYTMDLLEYSLTLMP